MPLTVPRYNGPKVSPAALPGRRISPDAPASAFQPAQGIDFSAIGNLATQIYEEEAQKADEIAKMTSESELDKSATELTVGPNGVLRRKGKNAFSAPEEVAEAWRKRVSEIDQGLKTTRQKMAFRKAAAQAWQGIDRTVQSHVARERTEYDAEEYQGSLVNSRNIAVAAFTDPEAIALSIKKQTETTLQYAHRNGWSEDQIEAKVSEAVSKTHLGIINRMADSPNLINGMDPDLAAQKYYDQHKNEIAGTLRGQIEATLDEQSVRGEGQRKSDEIYEQSGSRAEALEAARRIKNPKVREETEQLLNRRYDQDREIQRENQDTLYLQAKNILDTRPGARARSVIPARIWNQLDVGQSSALEAYARRNDPASDGEGSQNNKLYLEFLDKTPEELGRMNQSEFATKYWQHFDKSHRAKAETDWKNARDAARKPSGAADSPFTATKTFREMVTDGLRKSRLIDPIKKVTQLSQAEASLPASVYDEAADLLHEWEAAKGKKADPLEKQRIVDHVILSRAFTSEGRKTIDVMQRGKRVAQVVKEANGTVRVPFGKVPESERESIRRRITQGGGRVTRDKVERGYAAAVLGDTELMNAILRER
ncbi:MAG: hypothetical protein M3O61_03630 [Gemmatimonadota bacterium]|nr:hypothetical protein [Gemmatimonadota bacterium]